MKKIIYCGKNFLHYYRQKPRTHMHVQQALLDTPAVKFSSLSASHNIIEYNNAAFKKLNKKNR